MLVTFVNQAPPLSQWEAPIQAPPLQLAPPT